MERADFAEAIEEGIGDGMAHQIDGAMNRDYGLGVGTGVHVEVTAVLDLGGEHVARVFGFTSGKHVPPACLSIGALMQLARKFKNAPSCIRHWLTRLGIRAA